MHTFMKNHPLYSVWRSMIKRCYHANRKDYKWYGAKGVTVCIEWKSDFWAFVADMESTYQKGLTLDRIDPTLNYTKSNCRWTTWTTQQNNKRNEHTVFSTSTTGIRGITKEGNKFKVRLTDNKNRITLGIVSSIEEGVKLLQSYKESKYAPLE